MNYIFYNCWSVNVLDLRSFDKSNEKEKKHIFDGCNSKIIFDENWEKLINQNY